MINSIRSLQRLLPLVWVVPLVGGCVSVEAEVSKMEVTRHELEFEGQAATAEDGAVTEGFTHWHSPLEVPAGVESEILATEVRLRAPPGTPDLRFIEAFWLTMSTSDVDSGRTVLLVAYERPDDASPTKVLRTPTVEQPNLARHWTTDNSVYELTVAGDLPSEPWAVDVTVSFSARFDYQRSVPLP